MRKICFYIYFRHNEKREGRRESELLKALESSRNKSDSTINKERNAVASAAAAASASLAGSNMPPASSSDVEKESGGKLASLPPAKINFHQKVTQIATGLQHTLLLTVTGKLGLDVFRCADIYQNDWNVHDFCRVMEF